ncbi:MAG: hypothetical protein Q9217_004210 [Psora testacea]
MTVREDDTSTPSKIDSIRERELYRYYRPLDSSPGIKVPRRASDCHTQITDNTRTANIATSPDTTLTAFAQLCTLRLQAQRAIISVIDRDKQYFIAESTKTLNLSDTSKCEEDGDDLWAGCATVGKAGRLCEKTIEATAEVGRFPMYTVTNLAEDPLFNELPFVAGPPFFKYYAGTPLTTKRGINIGSVFVMDDIERSHLDVVQETFLGTMAQVIMKHMEITAEAEEHKKVMRLSMGMNAFVEGRSRLSYDITVDVTGKRWMNADDSMLVASRAEPTASNSVAVHVHRPEPFPGLQGLPANIASLSRETSTSDSSQEDSDHGIQARNSLDAGHCTTLARASNLLYDSLDLHGRGGIVFFDTTSRRRHDTNASSSKYSCMSPMDVNVARPAVVMSSATTDVHSRAPTEPKDTGAFSPLDETLLQSFLHRYPRGKLWSFDGDGALSSSDEDGYSPGERRGPSKPEQSRTKRKQVEAATLQRHFPNVRQLLFYGLWDAGSSRWFTAGFAWTTSSRQIFSVETELNFFMAFGNSVMAQVSRLASMAADRQKADFIGSISHELRSPLHGILASAEFLAETEQDSFQNSLVDTISSCGRTLLDTINHILDYSKINSFERNWRNARKPTSRSKGTVRSPRIVADKEAPPMLNIFAMTNVASITEEVVEGVYAGQVYQDISSTDATTFSTDARTKAIGRGLHVGNEPRNLGNLGMTKEVEVILDIARQDYVFMAQPGALKRVIMNIFGNALKYTQKGTITVKLTLESEHNPRDEPISLEDPANESILAINVTDTGKGISREYLRTSLFNPFCQEDVLASGTGLGLSIVRSIVNMLRGTIDVQSEVGVGTEVTIRLPLSRVPGAGTPVTTPSTTAGSVEDNSINTLARDYQDRTVGLYGFESGERGTGPVLKRYIEDWFSLRTVAPEARPIPADIAIVDEIALLSLLQHSPTDMPIVVLCNTYTRTEMANHQYTSAILEFVSKPFGPRKLAKALRLCLDKASELQNGLSVPLLPTTDNLDPLVADGTTLSAEMNHLTLETGREDIPIEVQTNGVVTASGSQKAQMALEMTSSNPGSDEVTETGREDFPFPVPDGVNQSEEERELNRTPVKHISSGARRPRPITRITEPITNFLLSPIPDDRRGAILAALADHPPPDDIAAAKAALLRRTAFSLTASNVALPNGDPTTVVSSPKPRTTQHVKRPPRLLLVDDNKINLRLLETCMKKRKYQFVDTAENGQLAVQAAEAHEDGYDIIFMGRSLERSINALTRSIANDIHSDISMPVMNGFEATRAIRDIEEERGTRSKNGQERAPALIVALTGLASSRDQAEAFTSGVDLFLTKPVSFKEVGILLDNWEAHGELKPPDEAS